MISTYFIFLNQAIRLRRCLFLNKRFWRNPTRETTCPPQFYLQQMSNIVFLGVLEGRGSDVCAMRCQNGLGIVMTVLVAEYYSAVCEPQKQVHGKTSLDQSSMTLAPPRHGYAYHIIELAAVNITTGTCSRAEAWSPITIQQYDCQRITQMFPFHDYGYEYDKKIICCS